MRQAANNCKRRWYVQGMRWQLLCRRDRTGGQWMKHSALIVLIDFARRRAILLPPELTQQFILFAAGACCRNFKDVDRREIKRRLSHGINSNDVRSQETHASCFPPAALVTKLDTVYARGTLMIRATAQWASRAPLPRPGCFGSCPSRSSCTLKSLLQKADKILSSEVIKLPHGWSLCWPSETSYCTANLALRSKTC